MADLSDTSSKSKQIIEKVRADAVAADRKARDRFCALYGESSELEKMVSGWGNKPAMWSLVKTTRIGELGNGDTHTRKIEG